MPNLRRMSLAQAIVSTSGLFMTRLPPQTAALRGGSLRLSTAVAENPLLKQEGLPLFDVIDASHIKPGVSETLSQLESQFAELEQQLAEKSEPTYADVVEAMEKIEDPVEYTWGVVGHLMGVKNSDELREVRASRKESFLALASFLLALASFLLALTRGALRDA